MASDRQIAANRANAQKSTGPRTPEGRAASSANSLQHGMYAKSTILPGEDPAEYEALRDEHYLQFAPADPDERDLLDLMVKYKWQLRRLQDSYDQMWLHYSPGAESSESHPESPLAGIFIRANLYSPNLINLSRMIHSTDRAFHRTRTALIRTQEKRRQAEAKTAASQQPLTPPYLPVLKHTPVPPTEIGFVPVKIPPASRIDPNLLR